MRELCVLQQPTYFVSPMKWLDRLAHRQLRLSASDYILVMDKKMPFNLTEAVNALPADERTCALNKIDLVRNAQRLLGMEPRNDSQLTFNYACGLLEEDDVPSAIANELVIVDKIYQSSPYAYIIEDVLREIAEHFKKKYGLPWPETWEMVRFYGPTMLKMYCIKTMQIS